MTLVQWQCTSHSGAQKVTASAVVILALLYTNFFTEFTDFLQHLDGRANAAIKDSKKFAAERKGRVVACPLESLPPTGAPSWTIKKDWMKGYIFMLHLQYYYYGVFKMLQIIPLWLNEEQRYCIV